MTLDVKQSRRLLIDISNYGRAKFQEALPNINTNLSKHIMLVTYMSQAQVHFDGILSLTLPKKPQGTTAILQLRTLQEYFINTKLITLQDNDIFANYLYINSEYERIKTTKMLLRMKEINQNECDKIIKEADKIINMLKSSTKLPIIPNLILTNKEYYGDAKFDLRKKCAVIDALDTNTQSIHKMVDNYDAVYKYLSNYVHPDARTILKNIGFNNSDSTININGDSYLYHDVVMLSCMYFASILEIFCTQLDIFEPRRFKLFMNRFSKYIHTEMLIS